MVNYYDILGIPGSANLSEIKTAFRKLAKIYHPDKNPAGQEQFKTILRAYETLINPSRKSAYDLKLKYHQNAGQRTTHRPAKKNWSFEEKELRRRQYYEEHIKKYEKKKSQKTADTEVKEHYNEYKYILYATPIAVALFLLIIKLASSPQEKNGNLKNQDSVNVTKEKLKMGEAPYLEYFGNQQYNTAENKVLTIKNNTGSDIIVCLFNENEFLRSCFIEDGYFAEIPQLPKDAVDVRYSTGSEWDPRHRLTEAGLYGAFTKNLHFYKTVVAESLGALNEITLVGGKNEGFEKINEKEFFTKN